MDDIRSPNEAPQLKEPWLPDHVKGKFKIVVIPCGFLVSRGDSDFGAPFEFRNSARPRASKRTRVSTPPILGGKKWLYRSSDRGSFVENGWAKPCPTRPESGLALCGTINAVIWPYFGTSISVLI